MSEFIGQPFPEILKEIHLQDFFKLNRLEPGKVRDRYLPPDGSIVLVTTDRVSAFDVNLGYIPYKGQVLNQLSAFWFERTKDIFPNHLIAVPDPNVMIVKFARPLPVEVVVRGYITGVTSTSIWGSYQSGERTIYGIHFRDGYKKGDKLDEPVITPTTKAVTGHDQRLTEKEIIERETIEPEIWEKVKKAALMIFRYAQEVAEKKGFLLLDTKMEFGLDERGKPMIIDELLTPDSSRYALEETYQEKLARGEELDHFDKEFLRLAYVAIGYRGEGKPPEMPLEVQQQTSRRYLKVYQITEEPFKFPTEPITKRIIRNLSVFFQDSQNKKI